LIIENWVKKSAIIKGAKGKEKPDGKDNPCIWIRPEDVNKEASEKIQIIVSNIVNADDLPQTAQQYEIKTGAIGKVYEELSKLKNES